MSVADANYEEGQNFNVQFVWRIPSDDYLRAIFRAKVLKLDSVSNKYVIELVEFLAGRQEDAAGNMRSQAEVNKEYWALVLGLAGRRIALAYEADDGRPLWLRLETLTGEHNFFSRLNEIPPQLAKLLSERIQAQIRDDLADE